MKEDEKEKEEKKNVSPAISRIFMTTLIFHFALADPMQLAKGIC